PLVKAIQARRAKDTAPAPQVIPESMSPICEHIRMPLRAEWTAFETSLREILALRPGDLLQLPTSITEQTYLTMNGTAKFVGAAVLEDDRVAVTITKTLTSED